MKVRIMQELLNKYRQLPIQARASFWFLLCAFLQKGISMLTTPIFTRLLTTSEYGQYSVFNSWLGIVTIIVSLNLSAGVYTQGLVKYDDDRNVFSSTMQSLSTILVLAWTVIYLVTHDFWNDVFSLTTVQMLAMLVMIWTTAVFNFWAAEQRVKFEYRNLVLLTILVSLAKPIIGIIFVKLATDKVTARILGIVLIELIGYVGLFVVQMMRGKTFFSAKYWKYAVAFNLPLIPHYLSQIVLSSADRIMIRNMVGQDAAGIYSLAYSLASIMLLFNSALMQTISPWIYQKIKAKQIKAIEPIAYTSLLIVATVNILLIMFAPEAVALFAPEEYYEAVYIIPPVALSVYFMYSYDLFAKFAFYYEKTKLIMLSSIIGAILNIVLNYLFINLFGYQAAGYTTLVCYIIYSLTHYNLMNRVCKIYCDDIQPYSSKKIFVLASITMMCGFLLLFTYGYPLIRYSVIALCAVVAFIQRRRLKKAISNVIAVRKKN